MNFVELTVTVMLNKDIYFADCGYVIGKNINKAMLLDESLKELHPKKEYKNYVFNHFYPLEKDKIYKKDRLYIFKIRGLDYNFIDKIAEVLPFLKSYDFKIIAVEKREIKNTNIKNLYTVIPTIVTIDNKPWLQGDDIELFKQRLEANLEKKYKVFYNEDINIVGNFIETIEFKNKVVMYFNYKGVKLLGNKINIKIYANEEAQKGAFLAMATGLGEKNSIVGAGFCQ
ncbi:CRISPR-associated endoribonuclease Cas6 [Clostridium senegalense]|uniref:CRISPR-associated endoribonuclease Cas6 n=1 Tax=Clostridium senegalense TaxID=1465809 RepID=A0A6M0H6U5_9CLOT|nr:CRISPR-associated endoribonuclease Cas6 [Clostridium senegalense]NEU06068.1 CRISPR-associated endoribonuclease Cas6 [Clostridium senegalense]